MNYFFLRASEDLPRLKKKLKSLGYSEHPASDIDYTIGIGIGDEYHYKYWSWDVPIEDIEDNYDCSEISEEEFFTAAKLMIL
jgi:hypothetical protein